MSTRAVQRVARELATPRSELLLPAALAIIAQADVWTPRSYNLGNLTGPAPVVAALYVVTSLALAWRRRWPLGVLAFIVTADAVEYLAFGAPEGLGSLLPTVVGFYAVGRYATTSAVAAAAPLVLLGITVHELKDPVYAFGGSNAVFYGLLAAAWPIGHAFARRAAHAAALAEHAAALAAQREQFALEAVTGERARIARELHDVVGHGLSVIVLQLVAAAGLLEAQEADSARIRLLAAERSARDALTEMRRLLGLLDAGACDPATAAQPGLQNLDRLIADTRLAGAQLTLQVTGTPSPLPPGLDLTVYRILQEALTNVLKHANPPHADIRLCYQPDAIGIEIIDSGAPADQPHRPGRGMTAMRERVALYHGNLTIGPRDDGGWAVTARLPISQ